MTPAVAALGTERSKSVREQPEALVTSTVYSDCCVIALVVYTLPTTSPAGTARPFNLNVYVAPGTSSAVITTALPAHIVSSVALELNSLRCSRYCHSNSCRGYCTRVRCSSATLT
ncbi:MAG: hypothetical protein CM15mP122_4140 [Bacteroidota bacterium]|nr:MAG: hypothetical protein CM15mP122_4140 [Bacteroidota bacterium]